MENAQYTLLRGKFFSSIKTLPHGSICRACYYSLFTINIYNTHLNIFRPEGQNRLEAIIVFEEFCKEMAAIIFVQHHAVAGKQ